MSVADYDCDGLLDIYVSRPRRFDQELGKAGWVGDETGGAPNQLSGPVSQACELDNPVRLGALSKTIDLSFSIGDSAQKASQI